MSDGSPDEERMVDYPEIPEEYNSPEEDRIKPLEGEAANLKAELAALRDALPKTKDGVAIVPGMRVWEDDDSGCWFQVGSVDAAGRVTDGDGSRYEASYKLYHVHPATSLTVEQAERQAKEGER